MPSPGYWREIPARYRLEASRCKDCGAMNYPAGQACTACRSANLEATALSRKGKVVTSTVVHVGPNDFAMETPYAVAIVETPEKVRLMVQVTGCDRSEVKPGTEVSLEFRRIRKEGLSGILCYGYKGVPTG
jgi:uncharacterized OB-fold protein